MSTLDAAEALRLMLAEGHERTAAAKAYLAVLELRGQTAKAAAVTYRCSRRCLLARVYRTPEGIIVYQARYKLSPAVNAADSVPEARLRRTEDGDRRWKPTTFFLDDAQNIGLNCDHLRNRVLRNAAIEADVRARHAEVVVP